jgi:hypothetical protein
MPLRALTLGLMLPYGAQPGLDLGFELSVYQPSERISWVLKPHLAGYVRPRNHISGMVGTSFGVKVDHRTPVSHTFSVGLDYLVQSQVTSLSMDLGSGGRSATRELRHFGLPTAGYSLAHMPWKHVGWTFDLRVGHTFSPVEIDKTFLSVGAGLRFALGAR